jgi:vacuolar-type H+-ATPase subunit E/Vma4
MAIEKIIEKIISESRGKAQSIIDQANSQAEKIIEDGKTLLEEEKEKKIKKSYDDLENEKQRKLALAKLESRKKTLQTRCDILDECFNRALKELMKLEGESLEKLIANILNGFVPKDSSEIIVREMEKDKFAQILSSIWGASFVKFCVMKTDPNFPGGGFILRTKRMEYDFTFKQIIDSIRPKIEREVIKILFPQ